MELICAIMGLHLQHAELFDQGNQRLHLFAGRGRLQVTVSTLLLRGVPVKPTRLG